MDLSKVRKHIKWVGPLKMAQEGARISNLVGNRGANT